MAGSGRERKAPPNERRERAHWLGVGPLRALRLGSLRTIEEDLIEQTQESRLGQAPQAPAEAKGKGESGTGAGAHQGVGSGDLYVAMPLSFGDFKVAAAHLFCEF